MPSAPNDTQKQTDGASVPKTPVDLMTPIMDQHLQLEEKRQLPYELALEHPESRKEFEDVQKEVKKYIDSELKRVDEIIAREKARRGGKDEEGESRDEGLSTRLRTEWVQDVELDWAGW